MQEELSRDPKDRNPNWKIGIDFTGFEIPGLNLPKSIRFGKYISVDKGVFRLFTNNPNHYVTREQIDADTAEEIKKHKEFNTLLYEGELRLMFGNDYKNKKKNDK